MTTDNDDMKIARRGFLKQLLVGSLVAALPLAATSAEAAGKKKSKAKKKSKGKGKKGKKH